MGESPVFTISKDGGAARNIAEKTVAEAWNERLNVWSGIFHLNLNSVSAGNYGLKINLPFLKEGSALSKEVKLVTLRD